MFDLFKLFKLDNLLNSLTGFIEAKIEYHKLQVKKEVVHLLARLVLLFLLTMLALPFFIFISFFLAIVLNNALSSQFLGFLFVAVMYLSLGIILFIFREKLIFNRVYREFFKNDKNIKVK
jgi:hypothetical protein